MYNHILLSSLQFLLQTVCWMVVFFPRPRPSMAVDSGLLVVTFITMVSDSQRVCGSGGNVWWSGRSVWL